MVRPVNGQEVIEQIYSSAGDVLRQTMENYPYEARLVGGALTTAGAQYTVATTQSTGLTSKSSALKTALSSTINWPGLKGLNIDEIEFGLTNEFKSTGVAATTVGFFWEMKNSTGSTWQTITAVKTAAGSTVAAWTARTLTGYRLYRDGTLATGYNRLPINLRLRFFAKNASAKGQMRVKDSSYVIIRARKVENTSR